MIWMQQFLLLVWKFLKPHVGFIISSESRPWLRNLSKRTHYERQELWDNRITHWRKLNYALHHPIIYEIASKKIKSRCNISVRDPRTVWTVGRSVRVGPGPLRSSKFKNRFYQKFAKILDLSRKFKNSVEENFDAERRVGFIRRFSG